MIRLIKKQLKKILVWHRKRTYGHYENTSHVERNVKIYNTKNLFLYDYSSIKEGSVIMNSRAKFIVKKWSGAAINLVVVTGNHMSIPGLRKIDVTDKIKDQYDHEHIYDRDVVINEDVHIGANVTLLPGVHIGRGAVIGACSVVPKSIKPYAVAVGNPAKQITTRFTIDEILHHESKIYPEKERYTRKELEGIFFGEKVKT